MKQILLTFALMLLPMLASAAVEKNGIYYNLDDGTKTAEVTRHPNKYQGAVSIPDKIEIDGTEYNVTSIGWQAFYNCSGLTSVTIPNSVTSIGGWAFYYCSGLTSITIPNSVTSIEGGAFQYCTSLTSISIPNSVTSIGIDAFWGCGLTSIKVEAGNTIYDSRDNCNAIIETASNTLIAGCKTTTIPNSVTSIGDDAFGGCSGLTSITIPNSVTTIGGNAFSECYGLTSVTIPNSVTSIGGWAFYYCSCLTSITIPTSVTSIENYAFSGCRGLTSITIPNSVTSIGEGAFDSCSGLTSVTIPNSVTSIGWQAFYGCSGLTSITIPNSVTSIVYAAFGSCSGLTSVKVEAGNTVYDSRDNCNAIIETASNTLIVGCQNTKIPNSVISIGVEAFFGCSGLTSITIPNSVTSINYGAFMNCSGLTSITIPNSVTSIGNFAFYFCLGLTSVTIPNSVTSIGEGAFESCSGLTSVTIPNSVTRIREGAFKSCSGLLDFYCYAENVPTTEIFVFNTSNIANATLHVPAGSVSAYQAAKPWNQFGTIVGIEEINGVSLNKTEAVLEKGKTMTLKATITPETLADKSVKWKSSNTAVATVTSSGKVKGVKAGFATITCTSVATGEEATCKVTVGYVKLDKTEAILEKGKTMTLTPTVYPSKQTDQSVTWKSSNTAVATVTSSGKVKGVKAGTATITCTSVATGLSTTCKVTVSYVKLDQTAAILEKGKTMTLAPTVYPSKQTDQSVTWKSSNTEVATVASDGKVKGVKAGTATITCTSVATGLSTTCKVTVSYVKLDQSEVTLEKGETMTLISTVYPSKQTDQSVTWKSSDKTVATVTSSGKVKGVKAGVAIITCTSVATGLSTTCKVTVTASSNARSLDGDDADVTGIEALDENPVVEEPFDVYDLRGRKVLHQVTSLDGLPAGVYIVNGKKVLKK